MIKRCENILWLLFFSAFIVFNTESVCAGRIIDRIVAVINDDIISLFELNQIIKPYEEKIKAMGYPSDKEREMVFNARDQILNQLIDQKLTDQEIKQSKISIDEKEIDNAIERMKASSYYTDEDIRERLANEGMTLEEYRNRLKEQLLRSKLLNLEIKSRIVITRDDVQSYYEKHSDMFEGKKKFHLRNILLKIPPMVDEAEKYAIKLRMDAILQSLKQGETFEQLAIKYSESSLASEGGDLGSFFMEELSPQVQAALESLAIGDVSEILETDQGYQLFYVQDIQTSPGKTLDEAHAEIEEKLYNEYVEKKFRAWLDKLRERSHIKIIQ